MKRLYLFFVVSFALIILVFLSGCSSTQTTHTVGNLIATPSQIPAWISGRYSSADLNSMISGGTPPYHCDLGTGTSLPDGLELSRNCTISGTHTLPPSTTKEVSPPFHVVVNDSANPSASTSFMLSVTTVLQPPTLTPLTGSCIEYTPCNTLVASANGGTPPYHFSSGSFVQGAPPQGMIVGLDGYLHGTAPAKGTYTFSVCVVDITGASDCTKQTSVIVNQAPTTTQTSGSPVNYPSSTSSTGGSSTSGGTESEYVTGNYQVKVIYSGSWWGSYFDGYKQTDIQGTGDATYNINKWCDCLSISLSPEQPTPAGNPVPETVQILQDGKVLRENSVPDVHNSQRPDIITRICMEDYPICQGPMPKGSQCI